MLAATRGWTRHGSGSPLGPLEGPQTFRHPDFVPLGLALNVQPPGMREMKLQSVVVICYSTSKKRIY